MESDGFVLVKGKKGRKKKSIEAGLLKSDVFAELSEEEIEAFLR